ncbi:MAG TPA: class I SAM-dependent methyltransferase [Calditrichia bacterium]|nr:class I SAM-dependent methyltransferase [Calditrichota bacterium]HQV31326.1 class I SAM-dependent methyltransferase [Calditrichia bacterium]
MIYRDLILPHLVHKACSQRHLMKQRRKVVPLAAGEVLELGAGSGLNLPFYRPDLVKKVWALEPSPHIWQLGEKERQHLKLDIGYLQSPAEAIPLENRSVDTVVVTYAFCTIPDVDRALAEARRVLKNNGTLLFLEHTLAPDPSVRRWQHLLNPPWRLIGGGCHLNRNIPEIISANGFQLQDLSCEYLPGWRPASFNCRGAAVPE